MILLRWEAIWIVALVLSACAPVVSPLPSNLSALDVQSMSVATLSTTPSPEAPPSPPFPERPRYSPGELVDYTAQTGDTLASLARRFNTTVEEILAANPFIPASATTMPPSMPMKIPIYYLPLWGSPYQIIPDSLFVNGPAQVGFNTQEFVDSHPGWLKNYSNYAADATRSGANMIDYIAHYYSVSPRLLLALLEYQAGALSQPDLSPELQDYPLGYRHWSRKGLFLQLIWAANLLNSGYYGYRTSRLLSIEHRDGRVERFDPWQNAATVGLHNYFNTLFTYEKYLLAISPQGFARTYQELFGDPWQNDQPHIPGSLIQPNFIFPFEPGDVWALTGGPHPAWGTGEPFAALDFAPPSKTAGCVPSAVWATAVSDGVVVRSGEGEVMLDLDGDGDERTGWNVFYLHVGTNGRVPFGAHLKQGDPIGHPSCEGGEATGTHIHIARKYNGEWIPAEGIGGEVLAFNLEGWIAHNGSKVYLGTLTRNSQVVIACTCSNAASFIQSDRKVEPTP
jgi:murein DD-endopeptidase MepM/ murein hydrolase activator NlpD